MNLMSRRQNVIYCASSLILAMLRSWSMFFYQSSQAKALSSTGNILLFSVRVLSYTILFFIIFVLMQIFFKDQRLLQKIFIPVQTAVSPWKVFLSYCAILAVFWLPHIIIKYPGALCWDSWQMLSQYRNHCITNFHSPFYSVLLGSFTNLFIKNGHAEYGLCILALLHYILFVLVFGYSVWLLKIRMKASHTVIIILLLCYSFNPYIIGYLGVVSKDTLYSVSVFLLIICLLDDILDQNSFVKNPWKNLLYVFSVLNIHLVRRNGIIILVPLLLCLVIRTLRKRMSLRVPIVVSLSLVLSLLVSTGINKTWSVADAGKRDAFSMCFQQTARYIVTFPDEISEEEADIIRAILPYEDIPSLYNPRIADPVKSHYDPVSKEATTDWLKLWAKWFLKHPGCYFSAIMEQNYYLFIPEISDNISLYRDVNVGYELGQAVIISEQTPFFEPIFHEPNALKGAKEAAVREYMLLHQVPVIRWLGNIPFYFYILLFSGIFAFVNRLRCFIPFVPAIITIGIVIISPVIYGHPRYIFPVIYAVPVLLVYILFTASLKWSECKN